ncbi:hypothetical protein G2W53_009548 [Senna tora]|uniref:Uncharacterized protein n=1 Tax=Senna tora TaxID=362788 RepID=A0A835C8D3_9FABA|nr:hypothetical protein G2W53_009548 [Senna tora]
MVQLCCRGLVALTVSNILFISRVRQMKMTLKPMQRTVDAFVKYPEDKSMEKAIMEDLKDKSIVEDSEDKLIVKDSEDMKIVEDSEDKEVVEDAMEFEVASTMDHEAFANE